MHMFFPFKSLMEWNLDGLVFNRRFFITPDRNWQRVIYTHLAPAFSLRKGVTVQLLTIFQFETSAWKVICLAFEKYHKTQTWTCKCKNSKLDIAPSLLYSVLTLKQSIEWSHRAITSGYLRMRKLIYYLHSSAFDYDKQIYATCHDTND